VTTREPFIGRPRKRDHTAQNVCLLAKKNHHTQKKRQGGENITEWGNLLSHFSNKAKGGGDQKTQKEKKKGGNEKRQGQRGPP